jgi:mannosyltransferase
VLALTAGGAALRFATLGDEGLWYDEALSAVTISGSIGDVFEGLEQQALPPVYFLVAWVWVRIFGDGDAALRSLSAVAGTLTIPVAYAAGRELVNRRAGLVAALLVALSPPLVWYSGEARSYALMVLMCALSLLFFARARNGGRPRDLALWVAVSALAFMTHYFSALVVAAEAALLLAARPRDRAAWGGVAAMAAAGLAMAPYALYQRRHGGVEWIENTDFTDRVRGAIRVLATGTPMPPQRLATLVLLAGLVLVALALLRNGARERRGTIAALAVGTALLALPLAAAAAGSDYVLDRNFLAAWVPFAIAAGAGAAAALSSRRAVAAGAAAALAVIVVAFAVQDVRLHDDPYRARDDWKGLAERLGRPADDRIVVVAPRWQAAPLERYRRELRWMTAPHAVREVITVSYAETLPRPGARFAPPPPPPFRQVERYRFDRMVVTRFEAPTPTRVAPGAITIPRPDGAGAFVQAGVSASSRRASASAGRGHARAPSARARRGARRAARARGAPWGSARPSAAPGRPG